MAGRLVSIGVAMPSPASIVRQFEWQNRSVVVGDDVSGRLSDGPLEGFEEWTDDPGGQGGQGRPGGRSNREIQEGAGAVQCTTRALLPLRLPRPRSFLSARAKPSAAS